MRPKVILFDLGGVLADLRDPPASMALAMTREEFWQVWLSSESVRGFETGKMRVEEFVPKIASELGIENDIDFEQRLRNWELRLFANAESLIDRLRQEHDLALLSNTNEIHWAQITAQTNIFDGFTNLFLSFETGMYKPHRETFEFAASELGCEPADVLFLDDSLANVRAAQDFGIIAQQVVGIEQVEEALNAKTSRSRIDPRS